MKDVETVTFESNGQELLEKARNSPLSSDQRLPIHGTPFEAITTNGQTWFAAWGQNKLTEEHESADELLQWIEQNHWTFLVTVVMMMMDSRDMYKAQKIQEYLDDQNKNKNEQ